MPLIEDKYMFSRHLFKDRSDAAEQLVRKLAAYHGRNPLVLAIPRGGVPMAKLIAEKLEGEVNVVLSRKLGAPHNPEYAIGAVAENGYVYMSPEARLLNISPDYVESEKARQLETIRKRRRQYTPLTPAVDPKGRVVIIVDDGLATGATMIAALHAIRAQHPAELVCAVPVAAPDSLEKITELADAVACIDAPPNFRAVGQFYRDFPQVEDREVEQILKSESR